jgi:16S rRNA (cytosine967-C5)-methyltransferase
MCCAPGGKTAQLLDNKLNVVSIEKSKFRSKEFLRNMQRLKFKPELINIEAEHYKPKKNYDVILIDAPCSSTGTIRKNPDIFIKPPPKNLDLLTSMQDNILKNASGILNKNGLIMYITCSLQKIEGERRIEKFLEENKNFSVIPFLNNDYPQIEKCITTEGFIRILPNYFNFNCKDAINGSDGFFIALLKMDE